MVVEYFQDAILLSHNLLNCPRSVQRWCIMGPAFLARGLAILVNKSTQWASWLLGILSRRWIHLDEIVDCGTQRKDIENVDVVVFPFKPVSKVQKLKGKRVHCGAGRSAVAARSRRR